MKTEAMKVMIDQDEESKGMKTPRTTSPKVMIRIRMKNRRAMRQATNAEPEESEDEDTDVVSNDDENSELQESSTLRGILR